jgi:hypothetical protein
MRKVPQNIPWMPSTPTSVFTPKLFKYISGSPWDKMKHPFFTIFKIPGEPVVQILRFFLASTHKNSLYLSAALKYFISHGNGQIARKRQLLPLLLEPHLPTSLISAS